MEGFEEMTNEIIESVEKDNIAEIILNSFFKDNDRKGKILTDLFELYGYIDLKRTSQNGLYNSAYDYLYIIPYLVKGKAVKCSFENIINKTNNKFIPELKFNIKKVKEELKNYIKGIDGDNAFIKLHFRFREFNGNLFTSLSQICKFEDIEKYKKNKENLEKDIEKKGDNETDERKKAIYKNLIQKIKNNIISCNEDTMKDLLINKELDEETEKEAEEIINALKF